jgi:hypothetical protein
MISTSKSALHAAAIFYVAAFLSSTLGAQEISTTTATPKSVSGSMTIDTAMVLYVSGDDAVLKSSDGSLRLLELQPGTTLTVDGHPVKPAELTVGAILTHVQVRRRIEYDVTTVRQITGTIIAKNGPTVTLRLDDGSTKIYQVPPYAKFIINGTDVRFDDVTTGSKINATVVKTSGQSVNSTRAAVVGAPPQEGTLLIEK